MTGSCGYEKEQDEICRKKQEEDILFFTVRAIKEGTSLVANGFRGRQQIEYFTRVKPQHWVEIVKAKP